MIRWLLIGFSLFFLVSNVDANILDKKFKMKKDFIARELSKSGIDNAKEILSDSRVELYQELIQPLKKPKKIKHVISNGNSNGKYNGYTSIFHPESVNAGKQVLVENFGILDKVEGIYGVPKELLVALFRVETNFGNNVGKYCVVNSLLTWVVGGPAKRAQWAMWELNQFLKMCRDYELDPFMIPGSTCGAFGLLQFIPSSFHLFAVDGDGDGFPDLFNPVDALHSSGNYLSRWDCKNSVEVKKAVYAYNHSWSYVKAVIGYAKELKKWMASKDFNPPVPEPVVVVEAVAVESSPIMQYEDKEGNDVFTNNNYFERKLRQEEERSSDE